MLTDMEAWVVRDHFFRIRGVSDALETIGGVSDFNSIFVLLL